MPVLASYAVEAALKYCRENLGYTFVGPLDWTKYRLGWFILVRKEVADRRSLEFALALDNKLNVVEDGIEAYEYWQRKGDSRK
jgi:hypothetical protein